VTHAAEDPRDLLDHLTRRLVVEERKQLEHCSGLQLPGAHAGPRVREQRHALRDIELFAGGS
jgi:hypothetical protein